MRDRRLPAPPRRCPSGPARLARSCRDHLVDEAEVREVVVDEEAEQRRRRCGSARRCGRGSASGGQRRLGRPLARRRAPGRSRSRSSGGCSSSRSWAAHDGDRAADQPGDVLAAERGERVDRPQRGVDRAQQRPRARTPAARGAARRGRCGVGGDQPGRRAGRAAAAPGSRPGAGPASGGPGRPGAISQTTRAADRLVQQLAERRARRRRRPRATRRGGRAAGSRRPG